MTTAIKTEKVGAMIWPEMFGVLGICGIHVVARGLDANWALARPFRRVSDWAHVLGLGGAAYCVATDRAPDTMRAVFYANMGLVGSTFGDWLYTKAVGKTVAQVKAIKSAEKAKAKAPTPGGGQGGGQLTAAQQQVLLQAAQVAQGAQGGGAKQPAASTLEF